MRRFGHLNRRKFFVFGASAIAAAALPATADAQENAPTLNFSRHDNVLSPHGRHPVMMGWDADTGERLFCAFDYQNTARTRRPAGFSDGVVSPDIGASVPIFPASTTKVLALAALCEWIVEEHQRMVDAGQVPTTQPSDALLNDGQKPYGHILARHLDMTHPDIVRTEEINFLTRFLRNPSDVTSLELNESIRITMLMSANEQTKAWSKLMGGDGVLLARMQRLAQRWGMADSRFVMPSGLYVGPGDDINARRDCLSTPEDMVVKCLLNMEREFPWAMDWTRTTEYRPAREALRSKLVRHTVRTVRRRNPAWTRATVAQRKRHRIPKHINVSKPGPDVPVQSLVPAAQYVAETLSATLNPARIRSASAVTTNVAVDVNAAYVPPPATPAAPVAPNNEYDDDPTPDVDVQVGPTRFVEEAEGVSLRGIPGVCCSKTGTLQGGYRAAIGIRQREVNGQPRRVAYWISGAESGAQRVAFIERATEGAFAAMQPLPTRTASREALSLPAAAPAPGAPLVQ